jgi:DNA-binding MarR family transcriptional regulator
MKLDRGEVLRLLGALRECSRHVERGVRDHPLDAIDVGILALAEQGNGHLRPSDAVEKLEVPFPSVTRHVRRLHRQGHVSIQPAAGDRRSYLIVETASGRRLLQDFQDNLIARFTPILRGWDNAEVRALADGLSRLGHSMTAAVDRAAGPPSATSWWRETTSDQPTTGQG